VIPPQPKMFIGPWQELALARQLQAACLAERNVQQLLRGDNDDEEGQAGYRSPIPPLLPPRRRRYAVPPPPPPPPPQPQQPQRPTQKQGPKQPQQQTKTVVVVAKATSMPAPSFDRPAPRGLRDVERMRRAYMKGGERATTQIQSREKGERWEPAQPDGILYQARTPDPHRRFEKKTEDNEEEQVDELMDWVEGLDVESDDEQDDALISGKTKAG
jgi:hypothetical protein